ncbi:MAG: hypothetical protein GF353_13540 [Candidatus Lokiarchaeota archaeon]|nr:hypothetical protein [Candidatus Lokiarchaeota archaeon]
MPLRIRWTQKENLGVALIFLGGCGLFQALIIFIAQFILSVGNYFAVILIPIGVTFALFYSAMVIYDSFAQVAQRRRIKNRFRKLKRKSKLFRSLTSPTARPLTIIFIIFIAIFLLSYIIIVLFLSNTISFIIAENIATLFCVFVANLLENQYAKLRRY